jgi:hypothetical protein
MSASDDIHARQPGTHYLLWLAFTDDWVNAAQHQANLTLSRLQAEFIQDHFAIELGNSGTPPVTRFGSAGPVAAPEALILADWLELQPSNKVEAWVLSLEGELLWTRDGGVQPVGLGPMDYVDDFLPANLMPIPAQPSGSVFAFVLAPIAAVADVSTRIETAAHVPSFLVRPFSATGADPATHFGGAAVFLLDDEPAVEAAFNIPAAVEDVLLLDVRSRPLWDNHTGPIVGGLHTTFEDFVALHNLKPIG